MQEKVKHYATYGIIGVATTAINFVVYSLLMQFTSINYLIINAIAWAISVLFAYYTNRIFVFKSKNKNITKEMLLFASSRLVTLGVESLALMVSSILFNNVSIFVKAGISVIIVILNYVLSKYSVFNGKEDV